MWQIVVNAARDVRRRRRPAPELDAPTGAAETRLRLPLELLTERQREVLFLHYYADLPLEQVAQTLNLTVPAIKSRLHRARAMLRNTLAESEETGLR